MGLPRNEIDDGLTLLALLASSAVEIVGVTTTFGNGPEDLVFRQTESLLSRAGHGGIPVVRGARTAGDSASEAASFIARTAREHSGRLAVLAIGPLTNIAAALRGDPDFARNVTQVYVMGGYLGSLRFLRREVKELNLSSDPEAAFDVLHSCLPVVLMSAQLCLQARFGLRHLIGELVANPRLARTIVEWFLAFSIYCGTAGFYLWDLVPAWAIMEPGRFVHRTVRVRSDLSDLVSGTLRVEASPGGLQTGGVIDLPERILRRFRFAADCARLWRQLRLRPNGRDKERGNEC